MVTGMEKFRQCFRGFENQYAIIGGTACDLLMAEEIPSFTLTLGDINRWQEEPSGEFDSLFQQADNVEKDTVRFEEIADEMASLKEQREKLSA